MAREERGSDSPEQRWSHTSYVVAQNLVDREGRAKREPRSSTGTSAEVALARAMAGFGTDEARTGPRWTIPPSSSE